MSTICDDLRAAILQAAMQGKLTKQLPEDGNAEDLLKEIKAEKEKLIIKGKNKKQKPLTPITDNETPFSIPENWKWVRMADLFTIVTGKKDANFGSNSGKYRFFTCARTPIYSNSYSFSGESILLAGNGDIGNISYYDGNFEAYQRTYVLQPFVKHTYAEYVLRHLMGNWVEYNKDKMFGTAIPYIRLSNVEEYLVAFPPLPEQKRIVEKVDELMARVADLEQSADALASLKKAFPDDIKASLLQAAMQGKLTKQLPEDGSAEDLIEGIKAEKEKVIKNGLVKKQKNIEPLTDIPFDIPESWRWVQLSDLVYVYSGLAYNKKDLDKKIVDEVTVFRGGNISNTSYYFKADDVKIDKKFIPKNELFLRKNQLITPAVTSQSNLGKIARIDMDYPNVVAGGFVLNIVPYVINDDIFSKLFCYFFSSPFYKERCNEIANKSGQAFYNLNRTKLQESAFPLPPLDEQKRIVERLDALMQNINVVGDLIASE